MTRNLLLSCTVLSVFTVTVSARAATPAKPLAIDSISGSAKIDGTATPTTIGGVAAQSAATAQATVNLGNQQSSMQSTLNTVQQGLTTVTQQSQTNATAVVNLGQSINQMQSQLTGYVVGQGGDASSTMVTAPGGVPRKQSDRAGDVVNILDLVPQTSASVDYTTIINQKCGAGLDLFMPNTGKPYMISGRIVPGLGCSLIGQPGTTIKTAVGDTDAMYVIGTAAANVTFKDISWDATNNPVATNGSSIGKCSAPGFRLFGGTYNHTSAIFLNTGCDGAKVQDVLLNYTSGVGIAVNGMYDQVLDNECEYSSAMCVDGYGSWGKISGNFSLFGTGAEFIALFWQAHDMEVSLNLSNFAADNGMSFSGHDNQIVGNKVYKSLSSGFVFYGDRNTATGNRATDAGQVLNPNAPPQPTYYGFKTVYHSPGFGLGPQYGFQLVGAFGGYAQENTLVGNTADDDQTTMTQNGFYIGAGQQLWTAGTFTTGTYVYANGSTWQVQTAGTSTVAPSLTGTGVAGVTLFTDPTTTATPAVFVYTSTPVAGTREPSGNLIGPNNVIRFAQYDYTDATVNNGNTFITQNGFRYVSNLLKTTSGPTVSTLAGDLRHGLGGVNVGSIVPRGSMRSLNNAVYQQIAATCTVVTLPSDTTYADVNSYGDGCKWLSLGGGVSAAPQIQFPSPGGVQLNGGIRVGSVDSLTTNTWLLSGAGTPLNTQAAPSGSFYMDTNNIPGSGSPFWAKESGTDMTGWVRVPSVTSASITSENASRALTQLDCGNTVRDYGTAPHTYTLSPGLSFGCTIGIIQAGTDGTITDGLITLAAGTGVTLEQMGAAPVHSTTGQFAEMRIKVDGTNSALVSGQVK